MSTVKSTSGDYTINIADGTGNMTINGNLNVVGNLTYIEVTDLKVDDPFITVAANNSGTIATAPFQSQGLVTQTSGTTWSGLRFNNSTLAWEVSPNVNDDGSPITAYQALATASTASVAGPEGAVQYRGAANAFAGSGSFMFFSGNNSVLLSGFQTYGNIGTSPTPVANTVSVFSKAQGSGGTGLYVASPSVDDELVSKSAAIVFAIIF